MAWSTHIASSANALEAANQQMREAVGSLFDPAELAVLAARLRAAGDDYSQLDQLFGQMTDASDQLRDLIEVLKGVRKEVDRAADRVSDRLTDLEEADEQLEGTP